MRSLRANLFLSVGCILLVIALLSYFVPRIFIRKDITSASSYLSEVYNMYLKKIDYLSKSWVTYRFVQTAAQLDAVSRAIHVEKQSVWEISSSVIVQDPEIAVVQVTDRSQKTAVISLESGKMYTPLWARDQKQRLWIKFPEQEGVFLATPVETPQADVDSKDHEKKSVYYLLFPEPQEESVVSALPFIPFDNEIRSSNPSDPTQNMYEILRLKESLLYEKVKMIQFLVPWEGKAVGVLHVDSTFSKGMALLADEIFSSIPIVDATKVVQNPFVVLREAGPHVDLLQFATQMDKESPRVIIGYSLSNIASEIAKVLQKPILLSHNGTLLQGFTPNGENMPLNSLKTDSEGEIWQGVDYARFDIPLEKLSFSILIPKAEKLAILNFFKKVSDSLIAKISLNLLLIALGLLALSLLFLARISKRITKPITQLALASEEIGKGKYEDLPLPPAEKRQDEIAILTHSFQKMVISLRDREKIRGVLNKVVSKEIASKILTGAVELGGEERRLTMLFSDIRGFTPLSETLTPQKLLRLLNTYMTRMCRIIDETHGVVDKFVGDEIMALYGAPIDMENHAQKALEAALLMIADLERWNKERGESEPQIAVGIGIHTGVAFAGNMGAEDRLNYTVVGANVNLAARLCSAAKPMQILVSEETYHSLQNPHLFTFHKLPPVLLKGIDEPVPVFEVIDSNLQH